MTSSVPPRLGPAVAQSRQPTVRKRPLFDPPIVQRAIAESFTKLTPRHMMRNPVMFVVLVGSNVIPVEEAMLRETFGEPYTQYCGRVRRWI